jgi:hypothetical protein
MPGRATAQRQTAAAAPAQATAHRRPTVLRLLVCVQCARVSEQEEEEGIRF